MIIYQILGWSRNFCSPHSYPGGRELSPHFRRKRPRVREALNLAKAREIVGIELGAENSDLGLGLSFLT